MSAHRAAACWSWSTCRRRTTTHWHRDNASGLARALDNCMAAIRHAREFRHTDRVHAAWRWSGRARAIGAIGVDLRSSSRSARTWCSSASSRPATATSCSTTWCRRPEAFAIAGLVAEETCLATAIDASRRGHHVTFLSDASASRCRRDRCRRGARAWPRRPSNFLPTSPTPATGWWRRRSDLSKGIAMDELSARRLRNVIPVLVEQRNILIAGEASPLPAIWSISRSCNCA